MQLEYKVEYLDDDKELKSSTIESLFELGEVMKRLLKQRDYRTLAIRASYCTTSAVEVGQ